MNLKNLNIHILKWEKQLSCLEINMWMNKIVKKFKDMINIKLVMITFEVGVGSDVEEKRNI